MVSIVWHAIVYSLSVESALRNEVDKTVKSSVSPGRPESTQWQINAHHTQIYMNSIHGPVDDGGAQCTEVPLVSPDPTTRPTECLLSAGWEWRILNIN